MATAHKATSRIAVVGIDLGNDSSRIALARGGKVEVVTNDSGGRKTPSYIGIPSSNKRLYGQEAVAQHGNNRTSTFTDFVACIGKPLEQMEGKSALALCASENKNFTTPSGQLRAFINVSRDGQTLQVSPEQLAGMMLAKLMTFVEREVGAQTVEDCVISMPDNFTEREIRALEGALRIAKWKPLGLLHESTALAVYYGFLRKLPETAIHVLFVDVGKTHCTASISEFVTGSTRVIASKYIPIGGRDFDALLFEHVAKHIEEKNKVNVREHGKKAFQVMKQVQRLKHVLTANKTAPWTVEYITDSGDATGEVTREEFNNMTVALCKEIEDCVRTVIASSGVDAKTLHSVEVIGGGVRVPAVLSAIQRAAGVSTVSKTCDGDESIVRGCTLACAMKSSSFTTAKFAMLDHNRYDIDIVWGTTDEERVLLFTHGKKMPITQKYPIRKGTTDFSVSLEYASSAHNLDCPALQGVHRLIRTVNIKGVTEKCRELKLDQPEAVVPKIELRVRLGDNGIATITAAELLERYQKPGEDGVVDPGSKFFIRRHKLIVSDQTPSFAFSTELTKHMEDVEQKLNQFDVDIGQREDIFNDVESYVLKLKRGVDEHGQYFEFIDPEIQPQFLTQLKSAADWLEDDGYDADSKTLQAKKSELTKIGDNVIAVEREYLIVEDLLDLLVNKCGRAQSESCQTEVHTQVIQDVSTWADAESKKFQATAKWQPCPVKEADINQQRKKLNAVLDELRDLQKKQKDSGEDAPTASTEKQEGEKEEEEAEVLQLELNPNNNSDAAAAPAANE